MWIRKYRNDKDTDYACFWSKFWFGIEVGDWWILLILVILVTNGYTRKDKIGDFLILIAY